MEAMIWLILFVVFLLMEAATIQLVTIWFAGGALAAMIAAFFIGNVKVQILIWLAVSVLLLALVRPFVSKYIKGKHIKTNVDSLIGQVAKTKTNIDNQNGFGVVVIEGKEWSAISEDGSVIPADTNVTIKAIKGVKLIVTVSD